jgi:N-acetylneuraminic acid mutarotase
VINGILYVAGGVGSATAVEAYDPAADTWTTKAPMPTARAGAAAGVINGVLYVAGGNTTNSNSTGLAMLEAFTP